MLNTNRIVLWFGTGVAALTLSLFMRVHPAGAQSPMPGADSYPGNPQGSSPYPGPGRPGFPSQSRAGGAFSHAIRDLDKIADHLRHAPADYGGHRDHAIALIEQAKRELRRAAGYGGNGRGAGSPFPGPGQPGTQPYPGHYRQAGNLWRRIIAVKGQ